MLIISPLLFTSVTPSDWQLHRCRGNQWHPKAGVAHLVQCVRPPRPLHQPARRELQLLLRAGIHWHLLPREWVIIRHTTHRLYLSSLTLSGNHMILTVIQTPVSLIVTLLVQITVQGKKKNRTKRKSGGKHPQWNVFFHVRLVCGFLFSHRMLLEIKQAHWFSFILSIW